MRSDQFTSVSGMNTPQNVLQARARLGEGPVWHPDRQLLYWIDIYNHRVHQFNPTNGDTRFYDVGGVVGCIGLMEGDRLLLAQRHHLSILDLTTGDRQSILELETELAANRFNDGKCDAMGRFWFGSMNAGDEPTGNLYRYDPDGTLTLMETGLTISNGLGWSPDNTTFYLTDTPKQIIYAYDFDASLGTLQNRRPLIHLEGAPFYPDGLTIDSEGCIWSAMWNGWCVIRFDPEGKEMERVAMPVHCPTCCTFGGATLTTLYITTASVGLSQAEIEEGFYAGDVFALETEVRGLPAGRFGEG